MSTLSGLVDAELDAFRARDLERYLTFFVDNVRVTNFEGTVLMDGIDEIRRVYGALFESSPDSPSRLSRASKSGRT